MLNIAVQRDDEDKLDSARRLQRLNTECRLYSRARKHSCRQCRKVALWATACPNLEVRLRERLSGASIWTPMRAQPAPSVKKWPGWRVALTIPMNTESSSCETSTPLVKGELSTDPDHELEPSSESMQGNELPPAPAPPQGDRRYRSRTQAHGYRAWRPGRSVANLGTPPS